MRCKIWTGLKWNFKFSLTAHHAGMMIRYLTTRCDPTPTESEPSWTPYPRLKNLKRYGLIKSWVKAAVIWPFVGIVALTTLCKLKNCNTNFLRFHAYEASPARYCAMKQNSVWPQRWMSEQTRKAASPFNSLFLESCDCSVQVAQFVSF